MDVARMPLTLFEHLGQNGINTIEYTFHIDIDHFIPLIHQSFFEKEIGMIPALFQKASI
ncbi:hypothetical protein QF042_003880 [Pedobacter sp. W3I1]|nr:hypothetical protein [Pedobacter sp. W3I1]MDQ0640315.1 hypothetical protein [Pedobacter sp. W3I1]